jgi:16S rRNA (guanine966-N2)-methyltransferase
MKLRIISGEFKGRLIKVPDSKLIRPMTDRVRETLFNILSNKIDFNGIKVLDIYAGSGSLGLECLSRGASKADFVEKDFAIYKNLQENISSLNINDKCKVYKMDVLKFSQGSPEAGYNLIIADPPFFKDDVYNAVDNLVLNEYLANDGFIIIERSIQTKNKDVEKFGREPFKIIGDACLYEVTKPA